MKIDFDLPPPLPNERFIRRTKEVGRQSDQSRVSVPRDDCSNNTSDSIVHGGESPDPSTRPRPAPSNLEANAPYRSEAASTPLRRRNVDLRFAIAALLVIGLTLFPFVFRYYKASPPIQEHDQRAGSPENTPETARQPLPSPVLGVQAVPLPSPKPNVTEASSDTPTSQSLKEADNSLDEEYQELRHSLSKTEERSLMREQAQWLREREKVRNNPSEYLRMTQERLQELNHSHTHSG